MKISNLNLYMIDTDAPDPDDLLGDSPGLVIDVLHYGWGTLAVLEELWRLIDDPRAEQVAALRRRIDGQDLQLRTGDVNELRALIEGLVPAIVGTLVSHDKRLLPAERVPALRSKAPTIFDHERPIDDEVHAVAEALHAVRALRIFLDRASAAGYEVHCE
jgi:hypothetical protein